VVSFGNQKTRKPENQKTRKPENQKIRKPENQKTRKSRINVGNQKSKTRDPQGGEVVS
jgi:hypothetical protein